MGKLRQTMRISRRTFDIRPGFKPGFLLHGRQTRHHLIQLDVSFPRFGGTRWCRQMRHCGTVQVRSLKVRILMVSFGFFIYLILRPHSCPGAESAPNRNEYKDISWGVVKAAGAWG